MKKIKVIVTELRSSISGEARDVDGRMFNEDGTPIMYNLDSGEEYQLGQISSSYWWAQQDCGYQRYGDKLDELFPEENGKFEFEYEFIPLPPPDYIEEQKLKLQLMGNNIIPLRPGVGYYVNVNGLDISEDYFPEEYNEILKLWNNVIEKIKTR